MTIRSENICICGGGSEAHAIAAFLSSRGNNVKVLTRNPSIWNNNIIAYYKNETYKGHIGVSDRPEEIIPWSTLILISAPSYAYSDILKKISKFISPSCFVGAIPGTGGFDYYCKKYLSSEITYFSCQRVPFVARTRKYGNSVDIFGGRHGEMKYAISNNKYRDRIISLMKNLLCISSSCLPDFLCVNLVNSSSLLHTARLYSLGARNKFWKEPPLFYGEWDLDASKILIKLDNELFNIYDNINSVNFSCMTNILDHYESRNAAELTQKISSIQSLKNLKAPMIRVDSKYRLDSSSRYFTEDFPYGIALMSIIAKKYGVKTKHIDKVADWGLKFLGRDISYVRGLFGKEI
jgi:hypothetical protein